MNIYNDDEMDERMDDKMDERMDDKMNNELNEKKNDDGSFEIYLEMTDEEMYKLLFCSRRLGMQSGDFLRMLINNCDESMFGNGVKNE